INTATIRISQRRRLIDMLRKLFIVLSLPALYNCGAASRFPACLIGFRPGIEKPEYCLIFHGIFADRR
ncbi:hypothetical protein, partial [Pseudomonas sp. PA-1-5A]|uniref:hypothetical protein n=1 Tax=Pseudomonas sp. PA-1-5A TaxID=2665466 RepID=UPI001F365CA4